MKTHSFFVVVATTILTKTCTAANEPFIKTRGGNIVLSPKSGGASKVLVEGQLSVEGQLTVSGKVELDGVGDVSERILALETSLATTLAELKAAKAELAATSAREDAAFTGVLTRVQLAENTNEDQQRMVEELEDKSELCASKQALADVEEVVSLLSSHRDANVAQHAKCAAGFSDDDNDDTTFCAFCPPGTYAPANSNGPCAAKKCASGTTDNDYHSATACLACSAGFYTAAGNIGSCPFCPLGTSDHDSNPKTPCKACTAGKVAGPQTVGGCISCLAGKGNYFDAAAKKCLKCADGTIDDDGDVMTRCSPKPSKPPQWATKAHGNVKTCSSPGCYGDGGRWRSWNKGTIWTNTMIALEFGRGFPHWNLKTPQDASQIEFTAIWAWWDGNRSGRSTCWFQPLFDGCKKRVTISRGAGGYKYKCDVTQMRGKTLTFDFCGSAGTCCSYMHMANIRWFF